MALREPVAELRRAARPDDCLTAVDAMASELEKWLTEGKRLFAEAEARIEVGEFLPALSSLAALPPLHNTLCERLSDMVHARPQTVEEPGEYGMYL
jgi:hypothetical protein